MPQVQPTPQEQRAMQVPQIQQVEPMPQANIEIHEIHSDLEEENNPSTYPIDVYNSMKSSIATTQSCASIIDSSFPQFSFPEINLSRIILDATSTSYVLIDLPRSTFPSTSPILLTSSAPHSTPTSPHPVFPQLDIPSISVISSREISTPTPTSILSSLSPIIPTPPITISPISVEIPNPHTSQYEPIVTIQGVISTTEEMEAFGKDAVVSLGKYFWSRK